VNNALGIAGISLGLLGAVAGIVAIGLGLRGRQPDLLRTSRPFAFVVLAGALLAVVAMERALITRDFTVQYVADNGSTRTPPLFNFATLWAALEGSILLWVLVLAGYVTLTAHHFRRRLDDKLVAWAMLVMFVVCVFFFLLLVGPANPFTAFDPPQGFDGPGPNPLLQNHILMAFHPPLLYLGYVGFTVPFAFAIAALVTGRVGEGWLVETRRWTLYAWGFLTIGIVMGSWWSYEVLGWGGYWAWDPVENASFLPWLTGTAYLHSVMVQERRGMLRVWNLSLLCATFSLTILGTFLTRSGVVDSVHAFTESGIGPMLLGFFSLVVLTTIFLIGWRGDRLRAPGSMDSPISREGAFLANNVLFAAFAAVVLFGTIWPLVVEALNDERISVGGPYFNRLSAPIGFTLLFLMAVAPALPWRKASAELLRERLLWPAVGATTVVVVSVALGVRGVAPLIAFGLGAFAAGAALRQLILATRRQGWRGIVGRTNGGMVVHLGVVMIAVAFAASNAYVHQSEFRLEPGQTATFSGHTFTYQGWAEERTTERLATKARVLIDGEGPWEPAISRYFFGSQQVGTPSTRTNLREDIQLSLLDLPEGRDDPATIRVTVQPLVIWLWIGGITMAVGTVLAAFPGRRRRGTDPASARLPDVAPAGAEAPADEPEPAGVA
jgi:cytochrome c-type biogenesis protein CcmF